MSEFGIVQTSVEIPPKVKLSIENKKVTVSGANDTLTRDFSFARGINIEKEGKSVSLFTYYPRKTEKALLNTIRSHIQNMINGAEANYIYKMKIVYAHFPITVVIKGNLVSIENFLGERSPRIAKIHGEKTKIKADADDVVIESPYIEDVGQTAANIRLATKIKGKDPRVFQDGCYTYYKGYGDKELWKLKF
jgi:large subunit ribosomal protein L6